MGERNLSEGKRWHRRGGVQWPVLALTTPSAGTFPQAPFSSLLTASPAPERPAKLPSFLREAHLSRAGSSPAATQWPLSALEPGTETQHTPSLTHFLFPPSGSGLGPERPYPDWSQDEGKHSPSPSRLSITAGLTPARLGGALQSEAGVGMGEDLRGKGRGGRVDKHTPHAGETGPLETGALRPSPRQV